MKSILIVLEQLNIGGVETYVYNQTKIFIEQGHNVIILAKKGTYYKRLKKLGAKVINHEFPLLYNIDFKSSNIIEKIIKKYNVTEVHINQYPCILSTLPACIKLGIPYVAYVHSIIFDVFNWFINTFPVYKDLFNIYFSNAYKIVTITEETKRKHSELFKINSNKYIVLNNSLDLHTFMCKNIVKDIKKFLIMGRFAEEKMLGIKNAIEFFATYKKTSNNVKLLFLGDGPCYNKIIELLDEYKIKDYEMLGFTDDVVSYIEKSDIVIGVDRCILEAIGMKRFAIISGYNGFKGLVTKNNIKIASSENFSGNNLPDTSYQETMDYLKNIKDYKKFLNFNYKFIQKNLDIRNNLYLINDIININYKNLYEEIEIIYNNYNTKKTSNFKKIISKFLK